ncbi:MAG: hypothetical protein AB8B69_24830 [Chitinophagales bacterium]
MKHKIVLCLIMALLLSSCMSSKKMVASMDNTDKKLNIPFVVDSISFEDKRKIVSQNGDIRLPLMSMPNEKRLFFPALSAVHQSVIETTIRENLLTSSTNTIQVVVEILDGVKLFSATWAAEREEAKVKLRLTFRNENQEIWCEAEGSYFVSSIDANKKRFEALYQLALKNITYKALEIIQEKMKEEVTPKIDPNSKDNTH